MRIEAETLRLYAVTDRRWLKEGETLKDTLEELLKAGVTCVQLREKETDESFVVQEAGELKKLCDQYGVPLIINDRPDIAKAAGASGVHLGISDMDIRQTRELLGGGFIIGASAHNVKEALEAENAGADYIGCGAVFGSSTKENAAFLSREELGKICRAVTIPVVAIGGITRENATQLAGTVIAGLAVLSALFAAENKTAAVREFLNQTL